MDLHTYAAMAHKGPKRGKTFEVKAKDLLAAKTEAARIAQEGSRAKITTADVSVQLQVKADGTHVIGAIL